MPLIGLIDEQGRSLTWDEISNGEGIFSDPIPVLLSFKERTPYCDYSATELLNDPLPLWMSRNIDYYESVGDLFDRNLGIAIHGYIEGVETGPNVRKEERMVVDFEGTKIGGTFDLLIDDLLHDYKSITHAKLSYIRKGIADMDHWKHQMSIYRLLLKMSESTEIKDFAKICMIVRDFRSYEYRKAEYNDCTYPRRVNHTLPLLSYTETEELIQHRIAVHEDFAKDPTPSSKDCDNWHGIRCREYCAFTDICEIRKCGRHEVQEKSKWRKKR